MLSAGTAPPLVARVEAALAEYRAPVAAELERFLPADHAVLYEPIRRHALKPGKGLRPAMCIATCRALGGGLEAALPSAAVLELFHNAFLVHDDIEDGSSLRRDEPALHALYGAPMAINAGDAMLALTLRPLLENARVIGLGRALRVLEVVAGMVRETAEGQAMELDWVRRGAAAVEEADYLAMIAKKTAAYSFVAPVRIGAIIGGAGAECTARLEELAWQLGVAFQIRDDVLNLRAGERWGKERHDDLWEGKRTLALSHALGAACDEERARAQAILAKSRPTARQREVARTVENLLKDGHLSAAGRALLDEALQAPALRTQEDVDFLYHLMERAGSLDYAAARAVEHGRRAARALDECRRWLAPSAHRDLIEDLIAFVCQRDY